MFCIPIPLGELIDRITILQLKCQHFTGPAHTHVVREYDALLQVQKDHAPALDPQLQAQLQQVNGELWQVEEQIRACDRRGDFSHTFVALAQQVYRLNDRRAALKRRISLEGGSEWLEEKNYQTGQA